MADESQEHSGSDPTGAQPLTPRRINSHNERKPLSTVESQLSILAERVNDLADRRPSSREEAYDVSAAANNPVAPIRARRFSRSGTIKGEEGLTDLLQGAIPAASSSPAQAGETSGEAGAAPVPAVAARTGGGHRGPVISEALHKRRLKLLIVGSEILGASLLVLGIVLGWLIFSDRTPSQDGTASSQSAGARKTGNSFDPTAAVAASDYALAAVSNALAAERAGDLPAATKLYDDIRKKEATLPGLNYQLAVMAVSRGDLVDADLFITHSLRDGEQVAACYYIRSTWAGSKGDYATAASSFEAAARAEPFSVRPFFFWGECLRRDGHPSAAIGRFDEALRRPCQPADADYIRFKRNLAVIEAGNDSKFESDLADKIHQPNVDGDWLLLAAANDLLQGAFVAGAEHLRHAARVLPASGFAEKVADYVFQSQSHVPNLAPILAAAKITEPALVVPPNQTTKPAPTAATGSSAAKISPPPDTVSDAPMIPTPVAPVSNDPAVWSIEKADPGSWPALSVSMAH